MLQARNETTMASNKEQRRFETHKKSQWVLIKGIYLTWMLTSNGIKHALFKCINEP
jgi:hypothetical protein